MIKKEQKQEMLFHLKNKKYYFYEHTLKLNDFPYWDILKVCKRLLER